MQQGHQTQGPQIMQGPASMIEPGLPQPSIQGPGTQLPPYQYPPGNQIYIVTYKQTQLIQASFLQKNQMLQMFFDIFTPEIPVSSKI